MSAQLTCADCFAVFPSDFELLSHRLTQCETSNELSFDRTAEKSLFNKPFEPVLQPPMGTRCESCGKRFDTVRELRHHKKYICMLAINTEPTENIEGATCDSCGKHFSLKHNLYRHQRSGCKGRPKVESNTTKYGIRTHSSLFCCRLCTTSFNTEDALKFHKQNQCHIRKKYSCQDCGTSFANSSNMYRHRKLHCLNRK